jgi:hypothetical protein
MRSGGTLSQCSCTISDTVADIEVYIPTYVRRNSISLTYVDIC